MPIGRQDVRGSAPATSDRHPHQGDRVARATTRVLVVAERLWREGMVAVLSGRCDVEVLGAAGLVEDLLERRRVEDGPVVVLLEVAPGLAPAIRRLAAARPGWRTVLFGSADAEAEIPHLATAGIAGWVSLAEGIDDLVEHLHAARRGEARLPPGVAGALLRHIARVSSHAEPGGASRGLTRREREVAALLEQGLSDREIAAHLSIALSTVKQHVHNILEKLGVRRRGEAVHRLAATRLVGVGLP